MTEGELWTRVQLRALLEARFSPPAVARFLAASQRRANDVRRRRPALARQSRRWIGTGAAAYAGATLGGGPLRGRARAALAWWALTWLMLDWHLGMFETADGRPRPLGAADALTLSRLWLVPVAAAEPTPLVCGLAAASDVLDGVAARAAEPTRAGRDLEGLADTCFGLAALRGARRRGWLGAEVAVVEAVRLAAGIAYALWVYFGRAAAPDPSVTRAARATTPVRVAGLVLAGVGRRRLGTLALAGGSAWSVAAVGRALLTPRDGGG